MAKTFLQNIILWGEDAEAFFGSFLKTEVTAIAPLAEQAITELPTEEAAALATGDGKDTGHILAAVIQNTTAKMAQASLSAAPASVAGAVGAAVAKHQANAQKP